jgi:hypothetical protein
MEAFSFLMTSARLEYYDDMATRMQKEETIRKGRNRKKANKKNAPKAFKCSEPPTSPILCHPLEETCE